MDNRKLTVNLEQKGIHLNALQRVLGMSIGCLPFLILLCVIGFIKAGPPSLALCTASFYSAVFSGFIGGVAFYQATQMVNKNPVALATVEATQVFEIVFTLLGKMILKGTPFPGFFGQIGLLIVFSGMFFHFRNARKHSRQRSKGLVSKASIAGMIYTQPLTG